MENYSQIDQEHQPLPDDFIPTPNQKPWRIAILGLMALVGSIIGLSFHYILKPQPLVPQAPTASKNNPSTIPSIEASPQSAPTPLKIPPATLLTGGKQMFQTFNNCGPASLTMALSYFGINETQQSLGQALRPYQNPQGDNDDKSVSLNELAAKAKEYDLIAYHRPAGTTEQLEALVALNLPVITRTLLTTNDDIGHYRVVKGYDQTQQLLIQDDSYQGKDISYTYQQFEQLWQPFNNEFVVLVPVAQQTQVETVLGELLDESNAWKVALARATQQLRQNPQDAYAGLNQSVAYYHLGQYQQSIKAYETVATGLPHRALWYQLEPLLAYYQLGQYQQFNQLANQILNGGNRAYSELHHLKGLIFQKQGQGQAAAEAFATANLYNSQPYWQANIL